MNDETPANAATAPTDEPKAETPTPVAARTPDAEAPEPAPTNESAVPESAASVAEETAPDSEQSPEPEPAPPPEMAEVAAAVEQAAESVAAEPEPPPEPVAVEPAAAEAPAGEQVPTEQVRDEKPAEVEPKGEEPQPVKPKRTRAAKAKSTPTDADATDTAATPADELTGSVAPTEALAEPQPENKKKWYAVKVQSGREDTIKAAILRKVAIEGLEDNFGEILIPTEEVIEKKQVRVKDKKTGEYTYQEKKVTKKKKKFHGYIFANVEFNDRILYLFRETSGVGDFLNVRGSPGNPIAEPMPEHEVQAMLTGVSVKQGGKGKGVRVKLDFEKGDRVRVREGSFTNQEGEVKAITEPKDPTDSLKITVILTLWGRPLEVELDHWQVEKV